MSEIPTLPRAPRASVDVVVADRGVRALPSRPHEIEATPPRPWFLPARATPARGSRDHVRDPNGENGI